MSNGKQRADLRHSGKSLNIRRFPNRRYWRGRSEATGPPRPKDL